MIIRKLISIISIISISFVACGTNNDVHVTSNPENSKDKNIYEFRDLQTNQRLGELILNDDDSVEITIDNSDIVYIGYVESLGSAQNYHLSASKPGTNFTNIVEGKDDEVYCIDCDILICDYDLSGNACFFAGLFNNLETGKNPREPYFAKNGVIPIGNGYGDTSKNKPSGQFARFITIVNEDETKSCKMAQVHTNDGFIWSGELEVGDVIFSKDNNAIFYTEGKHISGSFENDLTFMVKAKDKELDMEISLTCIDTTNGIYKVKSYEHKEPSDIRNFLDERGSKNSPSTYNYTDENGNTWNYNAPTN